MRCFSFHASPARGEKGIGESGGARGLGSVRFWGFALGKTTHTDTLFGIYKRLSTNPPQVYTTRGCRICVTSTERTCLVDTSNCVSMKDWIREEMWCIGGVRE